ncbi:MAG: response regulator [Proteobacteria bacterium]|nr:response regulator [Pseudomonadota bacterium]
MTENKNVRVLVVDDNPKIRALIVTILKSAEFTEIDQAENGKIACEILKKKKFDLILTDWMMPEMDGLELLQHIRNGSEELKETPVMMITASDRPDDIVSAAKLKINGYIVKPFKVKTVLAKINQVLNPS